ncbi:GNAT family N-acetyltransferase [Pseudoalteromonas sp. P1-7a]|uniref:GNAT family N-acetyltransferase n=1 Tax=Pseudoalteromonas sp. P1-7a TaxID=1723755 RepID=UPI0006D65DE2|nr:GNAT family N-acetyltransferase [Pseudoalteromonas sp. P1-7a]KPZ58532.1 putative ribosomal N-acetyltransferase YdaF [Pseudoalteromonas sp. P1-7a]
MNSNKILTTERLILRQWKSEDHAPFAELNSCKEVMEYFPNTLNEVESTNLALKLAQLISERGWGLWAVEEKKTSKFIGFVGLHNSSAELEVSPATEIGWRLSKQFWGKGYATEAAEKVLEFAFNDLNIESVISFTAVVNKPSQKVMCRLKMTNTEQNFKHPLVSNTQLKEHVLYKITKDEWVATTL